MVRISMDGRGLSLSRQDEALFANSGACCRIADPNMIYELRLRGHFGIKAERPRFGVGWPGKM